MEMRILATAMLLFTSTAGAFGASRYGVLTDFTATTITLKEADGTVTYTLDPALAGNTVRGRFPPIGDRFNEVKRGDKIRIEYGTKGEQDICLDIILWRPDAAGVVTAVGKDTITIKRDKGKETTYKLSRDLLDGSHPNLKMPGWHLFPSKFSEVTKGCKIEAFGWIEDGELILDGLDVIKEKVEEKDKDEDKSKDK
jgi:hypothetical protein